jgi:hypothetical protein
MQVEYSIFLIKPETFKHINGNFQILSHHIIFFFTFIYLFRKKEKNKWLKI